jgi:hypothetical protein
MIPATASNAANFQLNWTSTRRVKKRTVNVLHPVPFSVQYSPSSNSVSLLLSGKQAFAKGGQITVFAGPGGGQQRVGGAAGRE